MSNHTPGPWRIVESYGSYAIKHGDNYVVAGGCGCCNSVDESIDKVEDAQLIAVAPELLEVLSEIINDGAIVMTADTHRKARAIIAKARGE